ncbi:MAG: carboxypeptidase-like regulatory domain-containing protein [Planctomycetia bacterium]|nr:carboxypeptidase-like regulatory domain-containing protein [Planctomycetia bacterium]
MVYMLVLVSAYGQSKSAASKEADAQADSQTMLVQGQVTDESGRPVPGTQLFVYNGAGNLESGRYNADGLPMPVFAGPSD